MLPLILLLMGACSKGGGTVNDLLNDREWCTKLADNGPSPDNWDRGRVIDDCMVGLESGFSRVDTIAIYCDMDETDPPENYC
jgi:hypothetical protein